MQKHRLKISEQQTILFNDLYQNGHSFKEIAQKCNVNYRDVLHSLIRFGYYKPTRVNITNKSQNINEHYFDIIDNDKKAYFLGLLMSDGYICKNLYSYEVGIALKESDKYILEALRDELAPKKKLYKYKNSYKFVISSNYLVNVLQYYGICENKSLCELHFPKIPIDMRPAFIRGYFDGDGCITIKSTGFSVVSFCSNSKVFLEDLSAILFEYGIITRPINVNCKNRIHAFYTLYLSKRENQLKFKNLIYNNASIYLTRKYNKFMVIPC